MNLPVASTPLSVGIPHDFLRKKAPELAKDIVCQIGGARELATSFYGLTAEQWDVLRQWPAFKELVRVAGEELSGPLGMAERIRRQCRYGLAEGGIMDLFAVIADPKQSGSVRVKGVEVAAEIGGVGGGKQTVVGGGTVGGGGPLVVINMGNGEKLSIGSAPIEGSATRVDPA